jgi:MFS family permease
MLFVNRDGRACDKPSAFLVPWEARIMTDISLPASSFAEREFRVGNAMNKAINVLSRNLLPFSIVTAVAALPSLLLVNRNTDFADNPSALGWFFGGIVLAMVLSALSQAVVLYAAFEDMRGRPVDILASFRLSWRRFLPVIGVAICVGFGVGFASLLLIFPGLMLLTAWYIATPACVVEGIGPFSALSRSAFLTRGHRWKVFGMVLVLWLVGAMGGGLVEGLAAGTGEAIGMVARLIWNGLFGAFGAILVVVTYHDLRVAKEGVDTDQIAAVFE